MNRFDCQEKYSKLSMLNLHYLSNMGIFTITILMLVRTRHAVFDLLECRCLEGVSIILNKLSQADNVSYFG